MEEKRNASLVCKGLTKTFVTRVVRASNLYSQTLQVYRHTHHGQYYIYYGPHDKEMYLCSVQVRLM